MLEYAKKGATLNNVQDPTPSEAKAAVNVIDQQILRHNHGQRGELDTPERVITTINTNDSQEQLSYTTLVQLVSPQNGIPGNV